TDWIEAESRGFHGGRTTPESLAAQLDGLTDRRTTGVWDSTIAQPGQPVATVSSWQTELTVPGERSVPAWAISAVTVSPTHRRRGIARAMLEAELRTARRLGSAVAALTVSEATIYARYGFAPAAMMADWQIDTAKAKWAGPASSGRIHFVSLEQLRDEGPEILERVRLNTPGQIAFSGNLWERIVGFATTERAVADQLRAVRYDDGEGVPQGFAVFRVTETEKNFDAHVLDVSYLVSATDDAAASLWRFMFEMDLVGKVTAPLRPVREAFAWQVSDFRAVRKTLERDHLWVRILDAKVALESRGYNGEGSIALSISDPLGFANERILLEVDAAGTGRVSPLPHPVPAGIPAVSLTVNELGALYLGGVSAVTLASAGRITETHPGSARALDRLFLSPVAPWLSIWF
ncbi:MAG: GNAT family N-acetyltransferase, partial [Glaciihabitans sp.]